jgi:hypothetical protein
MRGGDYSPLATIDARTKEGALVRRVKAELTALVGGNPTHDQAMLIDRTAIITLHLAQLDRKIMAGEDLTLHDSNQYIAWANLHRRNLAQLGTGRAEPPEDPFAQFRSVVAGITEARAP